MHKQLDTTWKILPMSADSDLKRHSNVTRVAHSLVH